MQRSASEEGDEGRGWSVGACRRLVARPAMLAARRGWLCVQQRAAVGAAKLLSLSREASSRAAVAPAARAQSRSLLAHSTPLDRDSTHASWSGHSDGGEQLTRAAATAQRRPIWVRERAVAFNSQPSEQSERRLTSLWLHPRPQIGLSLQPALDLPTRASSLRRSSSALSPLPSMQPEIWFRTLPATTKTYFVASIITALLLRFWPDLIASYLPIDWDRILGHNGFPELWRLSSNFLVFGGLLMTAWQLGVLVTYFRAMELECYRSPRGAVDFLALLTLGAVMILAVSFFFWPGLAFGGPALLFFILFLYSRRDPLALCCIIRWCHFTRQWLPFVHLAILYVLGTNWALALLGIALGVIVHVVQTHTPLGKLRLPESVYAMGSKLGVGHGRDAWQVVRSAPGHVLGAGQS